MDPLSFMGGQGATFNPTGGAAAPSSALSGIGGVNLAFDNSGWTVSTGSSKASATNAKNDPLSAVTQSLPWPLIALIAGVLVWKLA